MTEAKRSATGLYIGGVAAVLVAALGLFVLSHTRASQAREVGRIFHHAQYQEER